MYEDLDKEFIINSVHTSKLQTESY